MAPAGVHGATSGSGTFFEASVEVLRLIRSTLCLRNMQSWIWAGETGSGRGGDELSHVFDLDDPAGKLRAT